MNKTAEIVTEGCSYIFIGWYHVTVLVMGFLIMCLNLTVFIFIKTSRILKQNAGNFILMGISLVDLLTGFHAVFSVIPTYYSIAVGTCDNHLFKGYNNAVYLLGKICLLGSIGHLLLLAGERMIGLFRPIRSKFIVTKKSVIAVTLVVWLVSICLPLLELTYQDSVDREFYQKIHVMFTIIGFWIFPTVMLCVQYVAMLMLIYKFQRSRIRAGIHLKGVLLKYKAFFIYMAMFISFLASCSPHFAIRIIDAFTDGFKGISTNLLGVIVILRYIPSLVNPIMYAFFKKDFQETFNKTISNKKAALQRLNYVPSWVKHSSMHSSKSRNTEHCELDNQLIEGSL